MKPLRCAIGLVVLLGTSVIGAQRGPLEVGEAGYAFDHLGGIAEQAEAAVASGQTILFVSGVGELGYDGLPEAAALRAAEERARQYVHSAKTKGIRLAIGYVCATSIVNLDRFDRNWLPELRAACASSPASWLQQDRDGKPLASWYGGDYRPACMSNPGWRAYEKQIVRMQIEAGCDGIFFDNPTVHPQGCYCEHCLKNFASMLDAEGAKLDVPKDGAAAFLRKAAVERPEDFLRFRSTIARDFLAEMREFARSIRPGALVTCNNSLNTPDVFFSQCRTYGYDIFEMSKVEDLIVVEDMATQARTKAGAAIEYGPVYEMLAAISRGKPLVAVTLAEGDYHTPANLVRLAMAEAAAHEASYLCWPTWPAEERGRMSETVRPQAELLRAHAELLSGATRRADVLVFLPFRRWAASAECPPLAVAKALAAGNVQFAVVNEEDLSATLRAKRGGVLLVESPGVLVESEARAVESFQARGGEVVWTDKPDWMQTALAAVKRPGVIVAGPAAVRAVVRDQPSRTVVHVLNLNVERLSSFQDRVTAAENVRLKIRSKLARVRSVKAITADSGATSGEVKFSAVREGEESVVEVELGRVEVTTIVVVE